MWVQASVSVIGVHLPAQVAHERHQVVVDLHQKRHSQHLSTHERYDKQMDRWMERRIDKQLEIWVDISMLQPAYVQNTFDAGSDMQA